MIHKKKNSNEDIVTEDEPAKIPIFDTFFEIYKSIVSQISSNSTDDNIHQNSADKLMEKITETLDKFTNESEAIIKKRDPEVYNFTKVVDDNKSMNDFYKKKYTSKYLKKFGMQVRSDEANEKAKNIKEELKQLKDRLGNQLNVALVEYGQALKKLSGEFVERTKNLKKNLKKQYNELKSGFIKKVKEEKSKL